MAVHVNEVVVFRSFRVFKALDRLEYRDFFLYFFALLEVYFGRKVHSLIVVPSSKDFGVGALADTVVKNQNVFFSDRVLAAYRVFRS